jgi:chromosome segregation ATPase
MLHNRDRICALLSDTRDELNGRFEEINSLQDQLRRLRSQGDEQTNEQQSDHSVEVTKLQQANADLDRLRAELEGQLAQSREELCLATEQRDQLRTDSVAVKAQITQLQSDHTEELESLRGKLQQVAVDLQEVREAHAAAEKARRDLSTTNAELESSLENISQQRETDYELIAELQSREAGHTKQVLGLQTRLDKCTEELQQTSREKSELEILLQQTKTELSRANDTTEDSVSRLLEERDGLQESLDEVESRHANEIDQVQGRLRELEAEAESLRTQLDKAIVDQKRVRATFEAELRKSAERYEASAVELDGVKAQLSILEAEFDGVDGQLQNALEERGALEEKNTNLESDIQRAFSMQRYLESQLKDRSAKFGLHLFLASSHCRFSVYTSPPLSRRNSNN